MSRTSQISTPSIELLAGAAKVDVTRTRRRTVRDTHHAENDVWGEAPLYVKALALRHGKMSIVIITVDAVAIEAIGTIRDSYLANVRRAIENEFGVPPENVFIAASHCHGWVRGDIEKRTMMAVRAAFAAMVPVISGTGRGREDRISENRRLKCNDGSEADVRRRYPLPADKEVAGIAPIDPEIGILRLERKTGGTLAVLYNFACHPILGGPEQRYSADFPGFASKLIEEISGKGAIAFFLQGCAGDVNPILYKDVSHPHYPEPVGTSLGLSTLRALKAVRCIEAPNLKIVSELISLPRNMNLGRRMEALRAEEKRLLESLIANNVSLDLKTFVPLWTKYALWPNCPSYAAHRYLWERSRGISHLVDMDADNRAEIANYIHNIHVMEKLTILQVNKSLLAFHQAANAAADATTIQVEIKGIRIGNFVLLTFPGELSVEAGLQIKRSAPQPFTFVSCYTNGYIYYTPTKQQLQNSGFAQEDCDCRLAPQWERPFQKAVARILGRL